MLTCYRFYGRSLLLLPAFLLLSLSTSFGQAIPNPSFESWTPSGKEPPFNWEAPTGWTSSNGMTEFSMAGVRRTQTSHAGSLGVSMQTVNLFGTNVPAVLVNGIATFDFSTFTVHFMQAGSPVSGRPSRLTGWYQFSSTTTGDMGFVLVALKKYNPFADTFDIVGGGGGPLPATSSFGSFEIPIEYTSEDQPDSIVVVFFSSLPESPMEGGKLIVDDLSLDGASSVDDRLSQESVPVRIYPNPAQHQVEVRLESVGRSGGHILLYNTLGQQVYASELQGSRSSLDLDLSPGLYLYRITDGNGAETTGHLIVR